MTQPIARSYDSTDPIGRYFAHVPSATRGALRDRLASIPHGYDIRGGMLALVGPALAAHRPDQLPRWKDFEADFERTSPFGFVSFRTMFLFMAQGGHLYQPELDIDAGGNALAAASADIIWDSHIMKPMLRASEGNLQALLDLYTRAVRLICNRGTMQYERRGRTAASVHIEDLPTTALSIVLPGFWLALARRLSEHAEVTLVDHGPMSSELCVEWN